MKGKFASLRFETSIFSPEFFSCHNFFCCVLHFHLYLCIQAPSPCDCINFFQLFIRFSGMEWHWRVARLTLNTLTRQGRFVLSFRSCCRHMNQQYGAWSIACSASIRNCWNLLVCHRLIVWKEHIFPSPHSIRRWWRNRTRTRKKTHPKWARWMQNGTQRDENRPSSIANDRNRKYAIIAHFEEVERLWLRLTHFASIRLPHKWIWLKI